MLPAGLKIRRVGSIRDIVQDKSSCSPLGGIFSSGQHDKAKRWQKIADGGGDGLQLHVQEEVVEDASGASGPASPSKKKIPPRIMPLPKGWLPTDWPPKVLRLQEQDEDRASDPSLWPERLRRAYEQAAVLEGEHMASVPMASVDGMMESAGHRITWKNTVGQLCSILTEGDSQHLTPPQVYELFKKYEVKILEGLDRAFKRRSRASCSAMPYGKLEEVVTQQGFTPLPQSMLDLIVEAAELSQHRGGVPTSAEMITAMGGEPCSMVKTLSHARTTHMELPGFSLPGMMGSTMTTAPTDTTAEDDIPWHIFITFCELLVKREGFSKRESFDLELVFRRFDHSGVGTVEASEWKRMLSWQGLLCDDSVSESLDMMLEDITGGLSAKPRLDIDKFHQLMRSHRVIEYAFTLDLFETYDTDNKGVLDPHELFLLFKKLGLAVTPEALSEMVADCQVSYKSFSFMSFWKVLQTVRHRDCFSAGEKRDIGKTFSMLSHDPGFMATRFVPYALRWLGFLLGSEIVEKVSWRSEIANVSRVTESDFIKIVRHHAEADLRSTRMIYREYASQRGASPIMGISRLSSGLTRLCPQYKDTAGHWLSRNFFDKFTNETPDSVTFNFEEFSRIARGCREMARDRFRKKHGFSQERRRKLKGCFIDLLPDANKHVLPPSALVELFRHIMPVVEMSRDFRELLKEALVRHHCQSAGMDMELFIRVMRTFEDLVEKQLADSTDYVCRELDINAMQADEVLDVYSKYLFDGAYDLTTLDLVLIFEDPFKQDKQAKIVTAAAVSAAGSAAVSPGSSLQDVFEAAEAAASAAVANRQMPSDRQVEDWRHTLQQYQDTHGMPGTVAKWVQLIKDLKAPSDALSTVPEDQEPWTFDASMKKDSPYCTTPTTAAGSRPTTKGESRPPTRGESRPTTRGESRPATRSDRRPSIPSAARSDTRLGTPPLPPPPFADGGEQGEIGDAQAVV